MGCLRWWIRGLFTVLALAWLSACASSPARERSAGEGLQWPSLPGEPRIRWVTEIRDYRDLGIGRGVWQRLSDFVFGEERTAIVKPYGVLVDGRGRLVVADAGAAVVHVMDRNEGSYTAVRGGTGITLKTPIGVAEDEQEHLYITDSAAGTIYRYSLRDRTIAPFVLFRLGRPTGIAYSRQNRLLYVSDTSAHQVVVFGLDGMERQRIGSRGEAPGQFNYPTDLHIDNKGHLLVTDALNARIQILTASGEPLHQFGQAGDSSGSFAKPKGVASDSEGHIYVCDALFDAVQIFDQKGRVLLDFGRNGSQQGEFWMPSGIFIDSNDYIYVADTYNRRIQVFRYLKSGDGAGGVSERERP